MTHLIEARAVTKQYTQGSIRVEVLKGVSITCMQNHTYAITGASGSGKSTLLHVLAGLDTPTQGAVYCDNQNINQMTHAARAHMLNVQVGLVFQMPYLIRELSVIENVAIKGMIGGQTFAQCQSQAYELLVNMGLADKAYAQPASLSGGQQQRVAIARAVFNKPQFLLADEPTGNLDEKTGQAVLDFLVECQKLWGMGIIVSSHNSYVVDRMQTVYELHEGLLRESSQKI